MIRNDIFLNKIITTKELIKKVYLENDYEWMVGFSGGKDSSVLIQIVLESLLELKKNQLKNKIYIVSSDTLIENPIVLKQLNDSLELLDSFSKDSNLPVIVKKVKPSTNESFWVNLIGRGYPLPNQTFRWCTDRLKIKPMTEYIEEIQKNSKKEILTVLGVRKGESLSRDIKLEKTKIKNSNLRVNFVNGKFIFSPIEEFNLYDIWKYLAESKLNFFLANNNKLSILYEDSSVGTGECPSSLDDKLQKGCGSSRWGCWLCPVVTKDKSLEGFINSGQTWLKPLLEFRQELMLGRDQFKNRYHGSLRISKSKNSATLVKYRYMDLKEKNNRYYLPKKEGRDEVIFGCLSENQKYLEYENEKYQIISEDEYRNLVDNIEINPYKEGLLTHVFQYVIRLNKNKVNNKLSIIGLGPYTLEYRIKILDKLLKLKEEMKEENIEIISSQEIQKIISILKIVSDSLNREKYLDTEINIKQKINLLEERLT